MAARTVGSGDTSVTSVLIIVMPKPVIDLVSSSLTAPAIWSFIVKTSLRGILGTVALTTSKTYLLFREREESAGRMNMRDTSEEEGEGEEEERKVEKKERNMPTH